MSFHANPNYILKQADNPEKIIYPFTFRILSTGVYKKRIQRSISSKQRVVRTTTTEWGKCRPTLWSTLMFPKCSSFNITGLTSAGQPWENEIVQSYQKQQWYLTSVLHLYDPWSLLPNNLFQQ